jgi:Regulator of ribonuclease activity B
MSLIRRLLGVPDDGGQADARLLAKLERAGVDLSSPIVVEHLLAMRDERAARRVTAQLASTGGSVAMSPPLLGSRWTVRVTFPMVVTLERLTAIRDQLGAFAAEHGGEYVGWGTSGERG